MKQNATLLPRVIGLDAHPDTFTAALLQGQTPAQAIAEKIFNQVPMAQLSRWAIKHTTDQDLFVLEASGNSFQVVRTLAAIQRQALVLESCQMGKLKEAHANNDKISAVRIGKAYLAGTAKTVWVPDPRTQERRDWFHAHRKAVKRSTQVRNRLRSYLSDHGVRLKQGTPLAKGNALETQLRKTQAWSPRQWQVIEGLLMELRHADEQRLLALHQPGSGVLLRRRHQLRRHDEHQAERAGARLHRHPIGQGLLHGRFRWRDLRLR